MTRRRPSSDLNFEPITSAATPVAKTSVRLKKPPPGSLSPNHAARVKQVNAQLGRLRVCAPCSKPSDELLGGVSSDLPCDRCKAKPCVGFIVRAEIKTIPGS